MCFSSRKKDEIWRRAASVARGSVVSFVFLVFPFLALPGHANADDAPANGAAVVEEWCRLCHLRAGDPPDPDMAPSYEDLVVMPGRDRAYFERFMHEDHFPMTTFRLFEHEKAAVVDYLVTLRNRELQRQGN